MIPSELRCQRRRGATPWAARHAVTTRTILHTVNMAEALVEDHPTLRHVDLAYNEIAFPGACHLASGLQKTESLQRLNLAYNRMKADAVHRLTNICVGHPSVAVLDVRGVPLRKSDRLKLDAHTKFTRLQIFIDAPERKTEEQVSAMRKMDDGAETWGPSPLDHRVHEQRKKAAEGQATGDSAYDAATEASADTQYRGTLSEQEKANMPKIEEFGFDEDEEALMLEENEASDDEGPCVEDISEEVNMQKEFAKAKEDKMNARVAASHDALKKKLHDDRGVEILPENLVNRADLPEMTPEQRMKEEDPEAWQRNFGPAVTKFHDKPLSIAEQESIVHTVDADRKAREAEEAQRKLDELHDLGDDIWIFSFSGLNLY